MDAWTIVYQTDELVIRARVDHNQRWLQLCVAGEKWHSIGFEKEHAVQLINSLETVWEE